jgi:hypothetical protein
MACSHCLAAHPSNFKNRNKMKTHKFARKPFYVDAVRVSEDNIAEVAEWCQGEVLSDGDEGKYVKVRVHRPLTDRQTKAFIGDWVLYAGTGFKVYTPKAFDKSFEKVKTLTKAQADEAGIKVPHEPRKPPRQPNQLDRNNNGVLDAVETPSTKPTPRVIPPKPKDDIDKLLEG